MTTWILALTAGWCVLRILGADRRFPWRIGDLQAPAVPPDGRGRTRVGPAAERASAVAPPAGPARDRPARRRPGGRPRRRPRRRANRRANRRIEADLCATADLLLVAVTAGHTLHTAVGVVGSAGDGPVARALGSVADGLARGDSLLDGIGSLQRDLGGVVAPLVTTLHVSMLSGAPLAPALQRLADTQRQRRRRSTEARARRLPVVLLAPLVGLVLPAFVILTVVPVGLTTARTGLEPVLGQLGPPAINTWSTR